MGIEAKTLKRSVLHRGVARPSGGRLDRLASLAFDRRARVAGFVVLSAALTLVAFVRGWQAVGGLRWPFDPDLFRIVANAVTFKDGGVLSDAHYAGVPAWYSPFTSALLGVGSLVTSVPVHRLGAQGGAVLNLLTPLALCFVMARWFSRRVALLALVAYLFVIGDNYPSFAVASYSPWLYVNIYATGLFILALAAVPAAVNGGATKDALVLGAAAGIVVLTHPAAAVLLGAVVAALFVTGCWRASRARLRGLARSAGIAVATALAVSVPYWLPIMIRYQGRVENELAGSFEWPELRRGRVWSFLGEFVWRWPVLVIAVGLVVCLVSRRFRTPRPPDREVTSTAGAAPGRRGPIRIGGSSILAAWTVISFVGLVLEVYRDNGPVQFVPVPATPSYHFLLSLSAALCVWFGIAVNAIVRAVLGRFDRRWGAAAVAVVVIGLAIGTVPDWRDRGDLTFGRQASRDTERFFDNFAVVDWIRSNTKTDDRFVNLGEGLWNGVLLPGLAGRKSVDINIPEFSNPFVSYGERQDDAQRMVGALRTCRPTVFARLARKYGHVRYVITQPSSTLVSTCPDSVPIVYSDNAVSIQRIVIRR